MLPAFDQRGLLPPGIHTATWGEFDTRYGTTPRRRALLAGLLEALRNLARAGCRTAYIDGSFVTEKLVPGDYDACWEEAGVDPGLIDPVLLSFDNLRAAQKAKYGGELFPARARATAQPPFSVFLDFFQVDKATGTAKGIVTLDLNGLPT